MSSKIKPLGPTALSAYEAERDLGADLLEAVRQMKSRHVRVVSTPAIEARSKIGLSQSQFARLLGVSVRTLQEWEQGRKQPSGAARMLLAIASTNPEAVLAVEPEGDEREARLDLIIGAIKAKRTLAFTYNGKRREVEPQCLGFGTKGTQLLRGFQLRGGRRIEPLFDVDRMFDLEMLDRRFTAPGPHYTRNDSAMTTILAQL